MSHATVAVFAKSEQEAQELVKLYVPCDDFLLESTSDDALPSAFLTQDGDVISEDYLAWNAPQSDAELHRRYERLFLAAQEEARTHGLKRFLACCHS